MSITGIPCRGRRDLGQCDLVLVELWLSLSPRRLQIVGRHQESRDSSRRCCSLGRSGSAGVPTLQTESLRHVGRQQAQTTKRPYVSALGRVPDPADELPGSAMAGPGGPARTPHQRRFFIAFGGPRPLFTALKVSW
jgi:hypothetical protein